MKRVTIISCLILMTALITSCEQETLDPAENAELNSKTEIQSSKLSKLEEEGLHFISDDYDNDGCLNVDDAHPWSNMSETIWFDDYTDTGVENSFVNCGSTMADLVDDLIREMNEEYGCGEWVSSDQGSEINMDNWKVIHRKFVRRIARLTYYWRKDKSITRGERSQLYRAAKESKVPYCYFEY
ncbi:hypothetical protein Lupro_10195 [Lutibacter profundi]|uniref:Uncharacterized protein n=1 Tax=Lutibacter profundi TaxID=1622118 RepID=A0A0X8G7Q0_9FLAO|nr:hypothetical protein [Lutibacter profundi]AMC11611.1 hypothetical protein Lupro_10195 [Lutibacter profundi]